MVTVSMEIQILFAGILFLIGLVGLLVRRNIIFMLMSIEIMLNSAALVFVIAGSHLMQPELWPSGICPAIPARSPVWSCPAEGFPYPAGA